MKLKIVALITCLLASSHSFATPGNTVNYTVGKGGDFDHLSHFFSQFTEWENTNVILTLLNDSNWLYEDYYLEFGEFSGDCGLEIRSSEGNQWSILCSYPDYDSKIYVKRNYYSGTENPTFSFSLNSVNVGNLDDQTNSSGLIRSDSNNKRYNLDVSLDSCQLSNRILVHGADDPGACNLYVDNCEIVDSFISESDFGWDEAFLIDTSISLDTNISGSVWLQASDVYLGWLSVDDSYYGSLTSASLFSSQNIEAIYCTFTGVDGFRIFDTTNLHEYDIQYCVFEDCTGELISVGQQGSTGSVTLRHNDFQYCISDWGQAICDLEGNILIEGCYFEDNIGKVVQITGGGTNADIVDTTFTRNWDDVLYLQHDGDCNVTTSQFLDNNGTAIYSSNSLPFISFTEFCGNDEDIYGPFIDLGDNTWSSDCEPEPFCFADCNFDYNVDVLDLLYVIAVWGTNNPAGDINEDGWVDVSDLLAVISAWGACP